MSLQGRQIAKTAAWFAGGALLGAGLGVLFAPRAGADTRRSLGRQAKRAQIEATRLGRKIATGIEQTVERGKALVRRDDKGQVGEAA